MKGGAVAGTVADALAAAIDALHAAGAESPRLDAELLLADATGLSRTSLIADSDRGLSGAEGRAFGAMVRRRVAREPVAYILGRKGFRRIELRIDRRALVPRPETELLVELAVGSRPRTVLDVGTGSGAIALAVADELPEARVIAVDTSAEALALAHENAAELGLAERVDFELGELPVARPDAGFDLVVANLPYVEDGARSSLAPEIVRYEPDAALYAGPDGLDAIRALIARVEPIPHQPQPQPEAPEQASGGGRHEPAGLAETGPLRCAAIALEVGVGQDERVAALLTAAGFVSIEALADLAGIARVVVGRAETRGSG